MAASDAFYNTIVTTVEQTIQEYGKQFTVEAKPAKDLVNLTSTAGTTRLVWGVVSEGSEGSNIASQIYAISGSSQNYIKRKSLLLPPSAAPEIGEKVLVDGVTYDLGKAKPIKPADVVCLYIVELAQ